MYSNHTNGQESEMESVINIVCLGRCEILQVGVMQPVLILHCKPVGNFVSFCREEPGQWTMPKLGGLRVQ